MSNEITREMLKALGNETMNSMNKAQLIEYLSAAIEIMNTQPERGPGRKDDVLKALLEGPISILELAEKLNISTKNVSSQLSYLRKDGYCIHTDEKQRKYLTQSEPVQVEEAPETTE